mgnify:CR=1|tara:strand:- start:217 stop:855 length:639 start_codon:yes stop_codon:yes gene_type:complete
MIKLKELIELKKLVYSEEVKLKHQNKIDMEVSVFREDLQLPYSLGFTLKPDNDSDKTMRELKYLGSLKTNKSLVEDGDDIKENFIPLIEKNNIPISKSFVKKVIKESAKFIMKLKYHYNRPRPYQVAEVYGMNLNGTQLDSMKTPSYPSGHAVQGYLVAEVLSHVDPRNSREYRSVGERIAHSRIIGKAHYPSDKHFGKKVANVLFQGLINK